MRARSSSSFALTWWLVRRQPRPCRPRRRCRRCRWCRRCRHLAIVDRVVSAAGVKRVAAGRGTYPETPTRNDVHHARRPSPSGIPVERERAGDRRSAANGTKGEEESEKEVGIGNVWVATKRPVSVVICIAADEQELKSLNKLGQRRQRRWTNDLLLRAMAPELSPSDIDGLFKPVPFGDAHPPSAFSMVEADAGMQELWRSCLLSVGMDKQERLLEKWREYVDDLNRSVFSSSRGGRE